MDDSRCVGASTLTFHQPSMTVMRTSVGWVIDAPADRRISTGVSSRDKSSASCCSSSLSRLQSDDEDRATCSCVSVSNSLFPLSMAAWNCCYRSSFLLPVLTTTTLTTSVSARKRNYDLNDVSLVKRRRQQLSSLTHDVIDYDADFISSKLVLGLRLQCISGHRKHNHFTAVENCGSVTIGIEDRWPNLEITEKAVILSSSDQSVRSAEHDDDVTRAVSQCAESSPDVQTRQIEPMEKASSRLGFSEYEIEAYEHRRSLEKKYHPVHCLSTQPQMSANRRASLVEWMVVLSETEFDIHLETLFLAVNVLDRFLTTTPVAAECFNLLAVTSILVAAKMEETYPPELKHLLVVCDDAYTRNHLLHLEKLILNRLGFSLMVPTSCFFLEFYCAERVRCFGELCSRQVLRKQRQAALSRLKSTLGNYKLSQYRPSLLAHCVLASVVETPSEQLFLKSSEHRSDGVNGRRRSFQPMSAIGDSCCHGNAMPPRREFLEHEVVRCSESVRRHFRGGHGLG